MSAAPDRVARVAIYYAPTADDPLHQAASSWLGRDAETGAPVTQPDIAGIAEATADPRKYGFHATLKPPMRLATDRSWFELVEAAAYVAGRIAPFELPPMAVQDLREFLALRETQPSQPLQALCDACVAELDEFRAPPDAAELEKRRRAGLTGAEDAMLVRWGYPYVFGTWFFHMTLTRRLDDVAKSVFRPAAEAHFATALARPRRVTDLCLFTQSSPSEAFVIAERIPLG